MSKVNSVCHDKEMRQIHAAFREKDTIGNASLSPKLPSLHCPRPRLWLGSTDGLYRDAVRAQAPEPAYLVLGPNLLLSKPLLLGYWKR